MTAALDRPVILDRFRDAKAAGDGKWMAFCPVHADGQQHGRRSLSIGQADDGRVLLHCFAGCEPESIVGAVGLGMADLFPESTRNGYKAPTPRPPSGKQIVATYDYRDEDGSLRYQVVRYSDKSFAQCRPDGAGGWTWNLRGVQPLLYNLPMLKDAEGDIVFVTEGEKDADNLTRLGLVAVCNSGGAGKWGHKLSEYLRGHDVVIVPDNDAPGRKHAEQVARSLYGVAALVRILELPNLPEKGDSSDWIDAQLGPDEAVTELRALVAQQGAYTPPPKGQRDEFVAPTLHASGATTFNRTDTGNAEQFAALYGDRLRYDHKRRRWLLWGGHWWKSDADGEVARLTKEAADRRYLDAANIADTDERKQEAKWAIGSESRQRREATLSLARGASDRRHRRGLGRRSLAPGRHQRRHRPADGPVARGQARRSHHGPHGHSLRPRRPRAALAKVPVRGFGQRRGAHRLCLASLRLLADRPHHRAGAFHPLWNRCERQEHLLGGTAPGAR